MNHPAPVGSYVQALNLTVRVLSAPIRPTPADPDHLWRDWDQAVRVSDQEGHRWFGRLRAGLLVGA